jgi:hypothetical protein
MLQRNKLSLIQSNGPTVQKATIIRTKTMTAIALQETIDAVAALLETVDRNNSDAMFDCLAEIELLTRDAVAEHSVAELLRAGTRSPGEFQPLSTAA